MAAKATGTATLAALIFLSLPSVMAQGSFAPIARMGNTQASPQMPPIKALLQDPGPIGLATTTAIFAHVAVGGGWNTVFTFLNTGTTPVGGNLILTASDGTPMNVSIAAPTAGLQADGIGTPVAVLGSSIPISVPVGGLQILSATPVNATDPTKSGWARVESSGGVIGGVGTFQFFDANGNLATIAGVLPASPIGVATIPVDNDNSNSRQVGYALANTGTSPITIKIDVVDVNGTVQKSFNLSLNPGGQVARFLWQDDATFQTFRGSMVLLGQGGANFAVVALVQAGSLYTVIPVLPASAPGIN